MLIDLKKQWIVSVAALAYRLHDLKVIKDWHYRQLCIEISQYGYRKSEPEGAQRELSLVFGKVFQMLRQEGVPKSAVARDLRCNLEDLDQALFGLIITGLHGGGQRDVRAPNGRSIHIVK
jgi:hypothetical protein